MGRRAGAGAEACEGEGGICEGERGPVRGFGGEGRLRGGNARLAWLFAGGAEGLPSGRGEAPGTGVTGKASPPSVDALRRLTGGC